MHLKHTNKQLKTEQSRLKDALELEKRTRSAVQESDHKIDSDTDNTQTATGFQTLHVIVIAMLSLLLGALANSKHGEDPSVVNEQDL